MASAVLANQNESSWAHMGKTPYSNSHLNSNPNPNPRKKQKQFHPSAANGVAGRYHSSNNIVDSPAVTQTASDDAYSFNQTSAARNAGNYGGYLTFNVSTYTKSELLELRKRLSAELDRIRDFRDRVESGRVNIGENPRLQSKSKKFSGNRRPGAAIGSVPKKLSDGHDNGSLEAINVGPLLKDCEKIIAKLIKHKYGYVFRVPVDAVALGLHDYHLIVKRPMDLGSVKAILAKGGYRTPAEFAADVRLTFNNALLYNPKSDPVNGMAMDLLMRFEEMFKLVQETFDGMRGQRREEIREVRINNDLPFGEVEDLQGSSWNNNGSQTTAGRKKPKPKSSPVPVSQVLKKADRVERMHPSLQAHSTASTASNPPPPVMNSQPLPRETFAPSPVRGPPPPLPSKDNKVGRPVAPKLPKPRAKDPIKREMSMDEKQKLGLGLQNLPQDKMPQLVQIIRKRNEHLAQDGDEIELDIETLDTETLWELDRFVTNWKKAMSKNKRQALMVNTNPSAGFTAPASPIGDADLGTMSDRNDDDSGRKMKDHDDEDVDIDDDMPTASFPPVEIEKDVGFVGGGGGEVGGHGEVGGQDHDNARDRRDDNGNGNGKGNGAASSSSSSSGSSSSESSSSSDSDSGSSSGSDSDADDAQS